MTISERVIGLGEVGSHLPAEPWILVFGGVTREGNRRARRAIRVALQAKMTVLWFDGFGERMTGTETGRLEMDVPVQNGSLVVIDYAREEQHHWLNRIVGGVPSAIVGPIEKVEAGLGGQGAGHIPVLTQMRRLIQKVLRVFQKKVLRRIAQIFRGRVGWRLVQEDVAVLAVSAAAPRKIIYGDDFALTQGWWAARVWPEVPTAMELTET